MSNSNSDIPKPSEMDKSNDNLLEEATSIPQNSEKPTGTLKQKPFQYYFTTRDLLIGAIMGVMGGFISGLIPFSLLVKTWYPFVGGTQLVSGHYLLWMVISYGLTHKRANIFFTALIQGTLNFLFGSSWGPLEIAITLYEGFFLWLGFLIMEAVGEKTTRLGWGLAGGIGNFFQVPLFWIITGKIVLFHWSLFVMACMFAFLSGMFIAGLLGRAIVVGIQRAGIY